MYRLRELERNDMPVINEWRNDPELIKYLGAPFRYINPETDFAWFDNYMKNRNNTVRCVILDEDRIIGLVTLANINHLNRSCQFNIMIGKSENCGKGAGYYAAKEMLAHAFHNLNMNRVELSVLKSNIRAQNMYKKAGFVMEGNKREAVYKNGEFEDLYMMSILREEYLNGNSSDIRVQGADENDRG